MDQRVGTSFNTVPAAERRDEVEIDLMEVIRVLWHRAWLLVLALVIGAVAAGIVTSVFMTPMYTASSTIYVFSKSTSLTSLTDIQISNQLTGDFQYIATTRETITEVIDELGLNTSYEKLISSIKVTNPSSSHMLKIQVQNQDPRLAADISNTLADVLREQIADIMNTDKPSSVERAVVPSRPSSPNTRKNAAIGGLALLVLTAAIILIKYFADDTITTEDDVRRYLDMNVLASIPFERTVSSSSRK